MPIHTGTLPASICSYHMLACGRTCRDGVAHHCHLVLIRPARGTCELIPTEKCPGTTTMFLLRTAHAKTADVVADCDLSSFSCVCPGCRLHHAACTCSMGKRCCYDRSMRHPPEKCRCYIKSGLSTISHSAACERLVYSARINLGR